MMKKILPLAFLLFVGRSSIWADDWPQFLGPHSNGVSSEKGLHWDWKQRPPQQLWKVPLGSGLGGVAVVGDRIYALAQRGDQDGVVCLAAKDGQELWHLDIAPTYVDRQKQGRGPRATPTVHQGKLYCQFANGELACVSDQGKKLWETDILKETGAPNLSKEIYYWGVSFSPLLEGDLVIVQPGGPKQGSVAAFHKDTGKLVWAAGDDPLGYASPIAVTIADQRQVICPTGSSILGLEPKTGQVLWRFPFGNQFKATGANPVWTGKALLVSAAYGAGAANLEIVPQGQKWSVQPKWVKKNFQNLMATSIIHDGAVYGCHGDLSAHFLRCLDLETGAVRWEERLNSRHQLLSVDGKLLDWDERGHLNLLDINPKAYTLKAELPKLLTYKCWAVPALADGRLYLRDERQLLCLDLRRP